MYTSLLRCNIVNLGYINISIQLPRRWGEFAPKSALPDPHFWGVGAWGPPGGPKRPFLAVSPPTGPAGDLLINVFSGWRVASRLYTKFSDLDPPGPPGAPPLAPPGNLGPPRASLGPPQDPQKPPFLGHFRPFLGRFRAYLAPPGTPRCPPQELSPVLH